MSAATTYTTRQGDMWDMISLKVWGDEHLMHLLLDANRAWMHVGVFDAGVVLTVPERSDG